MKTNVKPLQTDSFYHIYNRGINGENIFKEERNYPYFLQKYAKYVSPYVATYAYCLLKNHFHLLVRTHSEEHIYQENPKHKDKEVSWVLGNAFSSCFKSYAQAINKAFNRRGRLFEDPFRRIRIDNDSYFTAVTYYIHQNPQKHGFVKDFRDYPHSSYHSYLLPQKTILQREKMISWFGTTEKYQEFHLQYHDSNKYREFAIEFD